MARSSRENEASGLSGRHRSRPSYTFEQFRNDVQATLVAYYGSDQVKPRDKCIQVLKQAGRLDGDVIACQGYRRYVADPSVAVPGYHEGISFRTRKENRLVVNYPRLHHTAGTKKNQGVQQRYKPAVRIFKNLRNYLSAESLIEDDTAPSYFVECLIFNAPAECFKATHFHTVLAVLVWLHKLLTEGGLDKLVCGNEVLSADPGRYRGLHGCNDAARQVAPIRVFWVAICLQGNTNPT